MSKNWSALGQLVLCSTFLTPWKSSQSNPNQTKEKKIFSLLPGIWIVNLPLPKLMCYQLSYLGWICLSFFLFKVNSRRFSHLESVMWKSLEKIMNIKKTEIIHSLFITVQSMCETHQNIFLKLASSNKGEIIKTPWGSDLTASQNWSNLFGLWKVWSFRIAQTIL